MNIVENSGLLRLRRNMRGALRAIRLRRTFYGQFSFIHINKCGGTSIEAAFNLPKIHDTAQQRRDKIGAARWDRTPSFALVRNPYEKVSSHYRYRVKTNQTRLGSGNMGLNEWICRTYGEKDPEFYDNPLMFSPCIDWLTNEAGEIIVDLVIRLEEIDISWHQIEMLIDKQAVLSKANATSRKQGTTEDSLDSESIAVINNHFQKDFEAFGYARRETNDYRKVAGHRATSSQMT